MQPPRRAFQALWLCGLLGAMPIMVASAEDVFISSARLRGGFDANPMMLPQAKSSAFGGVDGAIALGRGDDDDAIGLVGEFQRTDYSNRDIVASQRYRVDFKAQTTFAEDWSLRSNTSAEQTSTYNLRSFDAAQMVKLRAETGVLRPFLTGELRYSTLNETSPIYADFLPDPQRFTRATIIPGVAAVFGEGKIGVSMNLSATRYSQEPDEFGFYRNNERYEPFLFASYKGQDVDAFISVAQVYGKWHEPYFTDVKETTFNASLSKEAGDFKLSLAAQRGLQETTFPISPATLVTSYSATVSRKIDDVNLRAYGRGLRTAYLDTPFVSTMQSFGLGADIDLGGDFSLGFEVARLYGTAMNGVSVRGGIATLSLTKVFKNGGDSKKEAEPVPPKDFIVGPALLPRSSGLTYQP